MSARRLIAAGCIVTALASCTPANPAQTATPSRYSCCEADEVGQIYEPGQTMTIRWTVVPGQPGAPPPQVTLTASLTGPYASVEDLKAAIADVTAPAEGSTLTAEPVRPSGQPGERPVSVIVLPTTAVPGYYRLRTTAAELGGEATGGSVIQVASAR
jgi:hypothetical protein